MRILFDARMLGEGYGIGVYINELLKRLAKIGNHHKWIIVVKPEKKPYVEENIKQGKENVEVVECDINHYSWPEQLLLPRIIRKYRPHLVHFPNFNVPIFYNGRFVVTIHDLVHHELPGEARSIFFRSWPYRLTMKHAVNASRQIISVSKNTKNEIVKTYPDVSEKKIQVVGEGVDLNFNTQELPGEIYMLREKYGINQPYLLFVGVWEPKKNLPFLTKMFTEIAGKNSEVALVLAGKEDKAHPEVKEQVEKAAGRFLKRIITPGFVASSDLSALYRQAEAFINVSGHEGFGLPGLEAMSCGTLVAVADTDVFREIYGNAAVYLDYRSEVRAAEQVLNVLNNVYKKQQHIKEGLVQASKYSWEDTSEKTLKIYDSLF